jgi:hypothetical protein
MTEPTVSQSEAVGPRVTVDVTATIQHDLQRDCWRSEPHSVEACGLIASEPTRSPARVPPDAWERIRAALGPGHDAAQPSDMADTVVWVLERDRRVCARLQECCQRHGLGLGGEHVDELIVATVDDLLTSRAPLREQLTDLVTKAMRMALLAFMDGRSANRIIADVVPNTVDRILGPLRADESLGWAAGATQTSAGMVATEQSSRETIAGAQREPCPWRNALTGAQCRLDAGHGDTRHVFADTPPSVAPEQPENT